MSDDDPVDLGWRGVDTGALADGVAVTVDYAIMTDGHVFISRDQVVEFLTLAGLFPAAAAIRECGREWDPPTRGVEP